MIDRIEYTLHPTFSPRTRTCRSPNFEFTCLGYGTFPVTCTIHRNEALGLSPTQVIHELDFEDGGGHTASTVGVCPGHLRAFRRQTSSA